jgi:hypothetical protein
MKKLLITSSAFVFTGLLAGCSHTQGSNAHGFAVHAMEGSFHYVGDNVPLKVHGDKITRLKLPLPIRKISRAKMSDVRVSINDNELAVQAKPGISEFSKEPLRVALFDGREIPFSLELEEASDLPAVMPAVVIDNLPRARLARPEKVATEYLSLLNKIRDAHDNDQNLTGFKKSREHFGKVALDNASLRSIFVESFFGDDLTVHVLEVQNVSSQKVTVPAEYFRFKGALAVALERETLESYDYLKEGQPNVTRAFIVTKAHATDKLVPVKYTIERSKKAKTYFH